PERDRTFASCVLRLIARDQNCPVMGFSARALNECATRIEFFDKPPARQWTVQPRSGSPQPDCTYFPSFTMHGTVGSPFEYLNISARNSLLVWASRSMNVMPFEL